MSQISQKYICLNSSSADTIHGVIREIGLKLAKRIVRKRKKEPFHSWDDLKKALWENEVENRKTKIEKRKSKNENRKSKIEFFFRVAEPVKIQFFPLIIFYYYF